MKKIIQIFLFLTIILISVFFHKKYFLEKKVNKEIMLESKKEVELENKNNLIKNLKYDVVLNNNSQYSITSDLSEIMYIDNIELVSMTNVTAKFIDKDNSILTIISDKGIFNNSSYNTKFEDNVKILYLGHIIYSEKLDLNFDENIATIYENVIYEGLQGTIEADNVKINLITKNIEIFMNNSKDKVLVNAN
tara:strand:+ start:259 stop:834 length:576 start_codon:yes stop_codon:yes gene_type:complete